MTVDEIYAMMGEVLDKAIPENFKAANLLIDRQEKYVSAEASYVNIHGDTCKLDNLGFRFANAQAVHELHALTTGGGHNRWNKLKFVMDATGKFKMNFIWDQDYQDKINALNKK